MVAWWWIPIAWVIGELMGFGVVIICMGGGAKNKKAAGAATSTAVKRSERTSFYE